MNKIQCYYYKTNNDKGTAYRCLYGGNYEVVEVANLNFKTHQIYRMNDKYEATDDDLFTFRDDFINYNNELKKPYFKNKENKVFKVDMFNFKSTSDAILNTVLMNSDQNRINSIPDIDCREFTLIENMSSCGLMTFDQAYAEIPFEGYGYDYSKYYFYMMKKIRIPTSAPVYYVIGEDDLNFEKLDFGFYRVRVNCTNKSFLKVFRFNKTNHYSHNTLKLLYKFKDKYNITFELQPADKKRYNYNMVHYEETVELKTLMKEWFKLIETLLATCSGSNWLVKTLISQAWGTLSKYKKHYVNKDDANAYDWGHLRKINTTEKYEYYNHTFEDGKYQMIQAKKAYAYGGIARIKPILSEFASGYIFNMLSTNDLAKDLVRCHTDGIVFNRPVNFKALKLDLTPIPEAKSSGMLKFYDVNNYVHVCFDCNAEYKYCKKNPHRCC